MPAFLATIVKWFIGLFLEQVIGRVTDYIKSRKAEQERRQQIIDEVKKSMEPLIAAKTKEEIDEAAKKALDGV